MRVNQLSCCADNCENNKNGYCLLSSIEVSGLAAENSFSTYCKSFVPHSETFLSKNKLNSPYADIKCSAKECAYNSNSCCTANYVDIAGYESTTIDDTLCSTFRRTNM